MLKISALQFCQLVISACCSKKLPSNHTANYVVQVKVMKRHNIAVNVNIKRVHP